MFKKYTFLLFQQDNLHRHDCCKIFNGRAKNMLGGWTKKITIKCNYEKAPRAVKFVYWFTEILWQNIVRATPLAFI